MTVIENMSTYYIMPNININFVETKRFLMNLYQPPQKSCMEIKIGLSNNVSTYTAPELDASKKLD